LGSALTFTIKNLIISYKALFKKISYSLMIGLKKIYSNSEIAGSYPYFSRIVKNGLPLNRSIRYSFQEELAKASVLEKTYGSSIGKENSVVKFLFSIDKYDTKMLNSILLLTSIWLKLKKIYLK